ncbi:MAG: DUF11 domain-containing protein [Anaerolineae bacterium]|nr:DUF11 domain-containing protein [Anaerolineae bacterium]
MRDIVKLKNKSPLIILLGMALFIIGLFWNSGQMPSWAQGQPPGTAPTRIPTPANNDDNDDQGDDDDGVSSAPGQVGRPGQGTVQPGDGNGGAALADLSLKKFVDDPLPEVGQVITYSIVISNSGPADAVDVLVLDQLPVGVVYSESVATRGSYSITTGLWNIELITVTEWLTLDVISIVTGTGRITNTTEITAASPTDPDSIPANTVIIEDDWNYVVITPSLSINLDENNNDGQDEDEEPEDESNASFIDPSQKVDGEPAIKPDRANSALPPLQIPADIAKNETPVSIIEQVETIPYVWPMLLVSGVLLITAGVWLARR